MGDRLTYQTIGIIDENLDAGAGDPSAVRAEFFRIVRIDLVQEKRSPCDLQASDAAQIPKLVRPKRLPVPSDRKFGIRDDEHHGDGCRCWRQVVISHGSPPEPSALCTIPMQELPGQGGYRQALGNRPPGEGVESSGCLIG